MKFIIDETRPLKEQFAKINDTVEKNPQRTNSRPKIIFPEQGYFISDSSLILKFGYHVIMNGSIIQFSDETRDGFILEGFDRTKKAWYPIIEKKKAWYPIIENGTLRGSQFGSGIMVDRSNHGVIRDMTISNFQVGIDLSGDDPVQWSVENCYLSENRHYGVYAYGCNLLKITGGKIMAPSAKASTAVVVISCASVLIDLVDCSFHRSGALFIESCSGVSVRSLYTEKIGDNPYADTPVIFVRDSNGVSFESCRFNGAWGSTGDVENSPIGLKIKNSKVSVTSCVGIALKDSFIDHIGESELCMKSCSEKVLETMTGNIRRRFSRVPESDLIGSVPSSSATEPSETDRLTFLEKNVELSEGNPVVFDFDTSGIFSDSPEQTGTYRYSTEVSVEVLSKIPNNPPKNTSAVIRALLMNKDDLTDNNAPGDNSEYHALPSPAEGMLATHTFQVVWTRKDEQPLKSLRLHLSKRIGWETFTANIAVGPLFVERLY